MTRLHIGRKVASLVCSAALAFAPLSTHVAQAQDEKRIAADRAMAVAEAAERWSQQTISAGDPDTVIRDVGKDPAALTSWVRTNTRPLAYRGALREWQGVMMDRAGNSLDRSLLLAEMLRRAGHEVRIAHASVSQEAVTRLADATAAPASRLPVAPVATDELVSLFAGDARIDAETVKSVAGTVAALRTTGVDTVAKTLMAVLPQVRAAAGQDADRDVALREEAEAALFEHYWVEVKRGDDWTSFDPSAEEVGPLPSSASFAPADLPSDLRYRVSIKVVLETWSRGALNEAELLSYDASPAELAWQPITLSHEPAPNPAASAPLNDPAALMQALQGTWVFTPTLVVGGKATTDQLFTTDGRVLVAGEATLGELGVASGIGGAAGGAGQIGTDALGGEPAGPNEDASPVKVTAEYLDIQIIGPTGPSEVERRTVFDLLSPEERATPELAKLEIGRGKRATRNLALSGVADILIFGAAPDAGWIEHRLARSVAAMARKIAAQTGDDAASIEAVMSEPVERVAPVLWSWAANRASALAEGSQVSPVAPNVAILWQIPKAGADGQPTTLSTFDIVANGTAHGTSFDATLVQGVLDTVLESVALDAEKPSGNTALAHATDIANGRGWVAIGAGAASALDGLELSPGARRLMDRDIARGYVVFAAPKPAADGQSYWWRIDLKTGTTIGMGSSGFGTATTEWTITQRVGWFGFCAFSSLGGAIVHGISAGGIAMGVFCFAGGFGAGHGTGALISKGAIELFIEILMIGHGNVHDE